MSTRKYIKLSTGQHTTGHDQHQEHLVTGLKADTTGVVLEVDKVYNEGNEINNQAETTDNRVKAEKTRLPGSTPRLTRKQRIFVEHLLNNPKATGREAAKQAYNVSNDNSAGQMASENLTKPNIIMALGKANDLIESTLIGVVKDWGRSDKPHQRSIALDTAKFIHDKTHGKAKQLIEQSTTGLVITVNLDGLSTDSTTD